MLHTTQNLIRNATQEYALEEEEEATASNDYQIGRYSLRDLFDGVEW